MRSVTCVVEVKRVVWPLRTNQVLRTGAGKRPRVKHSKTTRAVRPQPGRQSTKETAEFAQTSR